MKNKVPLTIYNGIGERTVIGTCLVEEKEQGWEISGVIEDDRYKGMLESKFDPDYYSIDFLPERNPVEVAWAPPLSIPRGNSHFVGTIQPFTQKDSNDD